MKQLRDRFMHTGNLWLLENTRCASAPGQNYCQTSRIFLLQQVVFTVEVHASLWRAVPIEIPALLRARGLSMIQLFVGNACILAPPRSVDDYELAHTTTSTLCVKKIALLDGNSPEAAFVATRLRDRQSRSSDLSSKSTLHQP